MTLTAMSCSVDSNRPWLVRVAITEMRGAKQQPFVAIVNRTAGVVEDTLHTSGRRVAFKSELRRALIACAREAVGLGP